MKFFDHEDEHASSVKNILDTEKAFGFLRGYGKG